MEGSRPVLWVGDGLSFPGAGASWGECPETPLPFVLDGECWRAELELRNQSEQTLVYALKSGGDDDGELKAKPRPSGSLPPRSTRLVSLRWASAALDPSAAVLLRVSFGDEAGDVSRFACVRRDGAAVQRLRVFVDAPARPRSALRLCGRLGLVWLLALFAALAAVFFLASKTSTCAAKR